MSVRSKATLTGISLRGQQGEPAGMMTVSGHMSDGSEVELIQDNGNVISHWKNMEGLAPTNLLSCAARRIASDYQTSDAHHPDHVLIQRADFDALVSALSRQPEGGEKPLIAIDRSQWTPCSPEWLSNRQRGCSEAPRVAAASWDGHSHYHPVNWPTDNADGLSDDRAVIYEALRSYTLTNMCEADDPSIGYPLVDVMSNDGAEITTGEAEMRILADHIAEALTSHTPPAGKDLAGEVERLRAALAKARWYVNDHQEAQPNDEARDDLAAIDAILEGQK